MYKAEYIFERKLWRVYDPVSPQNTVAYLDDEDLHLYDLLIDFEFGGKK